MKYQHMMLLLALATTAYGQETAPGGLKHSVKAPAVQANDAPVTLSEAHEFLTRVQAAIVHVNKLKNPPALKIGQGTAVAPRETVLAELDRFFELAKPAFSHKPHMAAYNNKLVKLFTPEGQRAGKKLAEWGCVDPVSVLLTGPTDTLTPTQFGDAVGYFVARIAELTHIPSTKFSPYLEE